MRSLFRVLWRLRIGRPSERGSQSISTLAPASGLRSERLRLDLHLPDSPRINRLFCNFTNPGAGMHAAGLFPEALDLPALPAQSRRQQARRQDAEPDPTAPTAHFLVTLHVTAGRELCGNTPKNILKTWSPLMREWW